jgi:uncharacterized protein YcbK (DUF882 family)
LIRRAVLALAISLVPSLVWAAAHPDAVRAQPARAAGAPDAGGAKATKGGDGKGKTAEAKRGKKTKKQSRYAPVELFQINTKETLMLRFYDDRGKPIKGWKKRFDKFMRCHLTGTVFKMDQRLAQMLYQVGRHFEGHRLEVVSGYRHPKVAKNPKSPHKEGVACDFRVAGIANASLRDYVRKTFDHAGVGYYPNSVFVHMDDRKKGPSAFWIDCAGPGQAASYAENPGEGLRNGRADSVCARPKDGGGLEGQDDIAQAGEAVGTGNGRAKAGNNLVAKPVEIKAASDPFGD